MKDLKNNLLLNAGIVLKDVFSEFDGLWDNLSNYFLMDENLDWFNDRKNKLCKEIDRTLNNSSYNYECYFWELFCCNKLQSYKNEKAINKFESLNVTECFVVVDFNYNKRNKIAFKLNGKYDVSFIKSIEDFKC